MPTHGEMIDQVVELLHPDTPDCVRSAEFILQAALRQVVEAPEASSVNINGVPSSTWARKRAERMEAAAGE